MIIPLIIFLLFLIPLVAKTNSEVFKTLMIISIVIFTILLNIFIYARSNNLENIAILQLSIIYFIISIYFLILYVVLSNIENDKTISEEKRTGSIETAGTNSSIFSIIVVSIYIFYIFYIFVQNQKVSRPRSNAAQSI